jgi:NADH-quinone oxidoreductase subunit G
MCFDHRSWTLGDWSPRAFDKDSVINQNNYTQELKTVVIDTEDFILKVETRPFKISMPAIPLDKEEEEILNMVTFRKWIVL